MATLNPLATPYQKNHFPAYDFYNFPQVAPPPPPQQPPAYYYYYHHHQTNIQAAPLVYSYNVFHLPPSPRKPPPISFPLPSPLLSRSQVYKQNKNNAAVPVPAGPRIPMSNLPGHRRKVKKMVRSGVKVVGGGSGSGQQMVWKPKGTEKKYDDKNAKERTQRWKNRSGEYFQMLPMESDTTSVMIKNIPNKYTYF